MSTLKATNLQNASSATTNIVLNTDGTITTGANMTVTGTAVMSSPYTMRNKIINGAMVIDQRNAGASVTQSTSLTYVTDRFAIVGDVASKYTAQQSSTAPSGFINSLLFTSLSSYTVGASESFTLRHYVEGLNIPDLSWGTASASTVTLSFWVRSSLTGTFGGSVSNSAQDRFYVFSYSISAANTWEQKTITIAGDTTGTWLTTNGIGIRLFWSLGTGATQSGTSGSWGSTLYRSATGATSVVGTNGATFYITGVQLERGTIATPFEYRNYQQELAMCQRYYAKSYDVTTVPGTQVFAGEFLMQTFTNNNLYFPVRYPVTMRTDPTLTFYPGYGAGASPTAGNFWNYGTSANVASNVGRTGTTGYSIEKNTGSASATIGWQYTASAEL